MSHAHNREAEMMPKGLRIATLALVFSALAIVSFARLTDAPVGSLPDMAAPIAAERAIILSGEMNGAATVLDRNGTMIARLSPEAGGFVSGIERALARVRVQAGVPTGLPVRLIRFESGRLALADPHTAWRAELIGFGRDNTAAFAKLLR